MTLFFFSFLFFSRRWSPPYPPYRPPPYRPPHVMPMRMCVCVCVLLRNRATMTVEDVAGALDTAWILLGAVMVFFMQASFCFCFFKYYDRALREQYRMKRKVFSTSKNTGLYQQVHINRCLHVHTRLYFGGQAAMLSSYFFLFFYFPTLL